MQTIPATDTHEDFNWAATLTVMALLLSFITAIVYVLVSSIQALD